MLATVKVTSKKPGLPINLNTKAVLSLNGTVVDSREMGFTASPPSPATDCAGACIAPDEACVSYDDAGVGNCAEVFGSVFFAVQPAAGDVLRLDVFPLDGSAPEIDTSDDSLIKPIGRQKPRDRGLGAFEIVPSGSEKGAADSFFDIFIEVDIASSENDPIGPNENLSLVAVLEQVEGEGSFDTEILSMSLSGGAPSAYPVFRYVDTWVESCECYITDCIAISLLTFEDVPARPGDVFRASIRPAPGAAPDPVPVNDILTIDIPEPPSRPFWNRRVSEIEFVEVAGDPSACQVRSTISPTRPGPLSSCWVAPRSRTSWG